jgi:hypothetical protein
MATVPTSLKTSPVPWTSTRSSMLWPEIKSSNNAVFQASSVIAVNGDKVTIEKYAILRGNGQLPAEVRILLLPCCCYLMRF